MLATNRFDNFLSLKQTLLKYIKIYNRKIPPCFQSHGRRFNKYFCFVAFFSVLVMACKPSVIPVENLPQKKIPEANQTQENLPTGSFISGVHTTSGTVRVVSPTKIEFVNFKTDSGPALEVWLSKTKTPSSVGYKSLGELKGISGDFSYDVPSDTDFKDYPYVVIWCVDFSVSFGSAKIS